MGASRGGAQPVPVSIRPTTYVSVIHGICVYNVLLYQIVLCAILIYQVNVPQPITPSVRNNVRAPSNVSMSVKRLCVCY